MMETTTKLISEYGILVVIAAIFLIQYVIESKNKYKREEDNKIRDNKYNESLSLLSESNQNIAKALELLRQSIDNNDVLLRQHDERSIRISENLNEIKSIVSNCRKK